jgi:hypothetical protein
MYISGGIIKNCVLAYTNILDCHLVNVFLEDELC